MGRMIVAWMMAACLLGAAVTAWGVQPDPDGAVQLVLLLRDGTSVIGRPAEATIPVATPIAERVNVRVSTLKKVEVGEDKETVTLIFRNGDRLHGVVAAPTISVREGKKTVRVPVAQLRAAAVLRETAFDPSAGLAMFLPFTGGAGDIVGDQLAEVHGATLAADRFGKADRAYRFNGGGAHIKVSPSPAAEAAGALTVSAWIRPDHVKGTQHLVRQGDFGKGKYRFGLVLHDQAAMFKTYDQKGWHHVASATEIVPGRWQHLVGVYDPKTREVRYYFNGLEERSVGNAGLRKIPGEPIMIGAEYYNRLQNDFAGLIDDVRIYTRALNADEVLRLHLLERQATLAPAPRPKPAPRPPAPRGYVLTPSPKSVIPPNAWTPDERNRITSRVILQRGRPIRTQMSIDAEIDELRKLLASGAVSKAVYEREMKRLDVEGAKGGGAVDEFTGRMQVLTRLYHKGEITTDAFLRHHTPVWNAWYHTINILPNGDFEAVEDRKAPPRLVDLRNWREAIMGYGDIGHSKVEIDRMVKHRGRQSLKFTSTEGPSLISLYSAPFMVKRNDSIKIQFFVKAKDLKRGYTGRAATINLAAAGSSLDLRPALRFHVPEGTYDWTRQEARLQIFGYVPEGKVMPCRLAVEFFGEGTMWLDDIVVCPTTRRSSRTAQ